MDVNAINHRNNRCASRCLSALWVPFCSALGYTTWWNLKQIIAANSCPLTTTPWCACFFPASSVSDAHPSAGRVDSQRAQCLLGALVHTDDQRHERQRLVHHQHRLGLWQLGQRRGQREWPHRLRSAEVPGVRIAVHNLRHVRLQRLQHDLTVRGG